MCVYIYIYTDIYIMMYSTIQEVKSSCFYLPLCRTLKLKEFLKSDFLNHENFTIFFHELSVLREE